MNRKSVQGGIISVLYTAWTVGGMLFALTISSVLVEGYLPEYAVGWLGSPVGLMVYALVGYMLSAIIIILPFFLAKGMTFKELLVRLSCSKAISGSMISWAFFAWGLYAIANVIIAVALMTIQLPGIDLMQNQNVGFSGLNGWPEYVAAFVVLVIAAPFFEELIFRGFLYGSIRKRGSFVFATLLTSIAFALVHGQVNVGIDVFVLSLFLGYLRERFDSIWPGVMVHALKNGLAYTLLYILPLYGISLI